MGASAKMIVLCCIDPRYRHATQEFVEKKYGVAPEAYDLVGDAGGCKEVTEGTAAGDRAMLNIDIAVKRHGATRVVFVNHLDCSYYGGTASHGGLDGELRRFRKDLRAAAAKVRAKYPNVEVDCYIVGHNLGTYAFESA